MSVKQKNFKMEKYGAMKRKDGRKKNLHKIILGWLDSPVGRGPCPPLMNAQQLWLPAQSQGSQRSSMQSEAPPLTEVLWTALASKGRSISLLQ